jgi:hypothetical protein
MADETAQEQEVSTKLYERLWSHDRSLTSVKVTITNENAGKIGEALVGNEEVANLELILDDTLTLEASVDPLVKFLRESRRIKCLVVSSCGDSDETTVHVVERFLRAASQSTSITTVQLSLTTFACESLAALLRLTSTVTCLVIKECLIEGQIQADVLSTGFRENKSLEEVHLFALESAFTNPILQGLRDHGRLQQLTLSGNDDNNGLPIEQTASEVRQLLQSSVPLRGLFLECPGKFTKDNFEPIKLGLQSNGTVTKLTLADCDFDEDSTALFEEMFQTSCTELDTLALSCTTYFNKSWGFTHAAVMLAHLLRQKNSSLKHIEIRTFGHDAPLDICPLMPALEVASPLESLLVEQADANEVESLILTLPKMVGLKKLKIKFGADAFTGEFTKDDLINAIDKNGSLLEVNLDHDEEILRFLLDDADRQRLKKCWVRNRKTQEIHAAPLKVPVHKWPSILHGALECCNGHDVTWDVLHVLPNVLRLGDADREHPALPEIREDDVEGRAFSVSSWKGKHAVPVEVQALVRKKSSSSGQHFVDGMEGSCLFRILAVLEERCGMDFSGRDVHVKVICRAHPREDHSNAGLDLGLTLAVALVSSLTSIPVRADTVFVGEVDLLGKLLLPSGTEPWKQMEATRKMCLARIVGPPVPTMVSLKSGQECQEATPSTRKWIQCDTLLTAINAGLVEPVVAGGSKRKRSTDDNDNGDVQATKRRSTQP